MASTTPDISTAVNDAEYWLHRYEENVDGFRYIHVPRDMHRELTFVTDEHLPEDIEHFSFSRQDLSQYQPTTGPLHFIFHSAYCCSTMLARAFDIPGVSMGLKEPQILNDMIGWRRRGAEPRNVAAVTDHALKMLARPFDSGEAIVIKPSNMVNPLAAMMMAMHPGAKALFLYAPIESFLQSIAKKEMWGRKWVRDLLVGIARDRYLVGGMDTEELLQLTDLQVAALAWLSQHNLFADIAKKVGQDRVRYLDSASFLGNQAEVMERLTDWFDLDLQPGQLEQVLDGPAFTTHSKLDKNVPGQIFDAVSRAEEQAHAADLHGEEIAMVTEWIASVAKQFEVQLDPEPRLLAS